MSDTVFLVSRTLILAQRVSDTQLLRPSIVSKWSGLRGLVVLRKRCGIPGRLPSLRSGVGLGLHTRRGIPGRFCRDGSRVALVLRTRRRIAAVVPSPVTQFLKAGKCFRHYIERLRHFLTLCCVYNAFLDTFSPAFNASGLRGQVLPGGRREVAVALGGGLELRADPENAAVVTESARAHSYYSSKQVQKTC